MRRVNILSTRDLFPGGFFYLAIGILFVSFGFILVSQKIWDYDFWWHLATGRYIVESGSIPTTDPFSFTSQLPENSNLYPLREKFILTQYWLAQVVFYLLHKNFGPPGIGILRAVTLLSSLLIIFKALKDRGVSPFISYPFIFLSFMGLLRSFGERPVLFTIMFSVICFVLVDDYVRNRSKAFFLLPGLMLLWANLHGGYIMGDVIIVVFMLVEGLRMVLHRSDFTEREKALFFSVLILSAGASGINPNGFFAFDIALSREYAPFYTGIQEYQSPFLLYKRHLTRVDYAYVTALALFPVVVILRNKKFNPAHFLILLILAAGSVSASRFTVYYCLMASIVLGIELDLWLKEHGSRIAAHQDRINKTFSLVMVVSSLLYCAGVVNTSAVKIKESSWTVPIGAADFLKDNAIKGNVLNDMGAGGYLSWRLYPDVKTFIDTRSLNYTVMNEYAWLALATETISNPVLPPGKVPLWKRILDNYQIQTVVFTPLDVYGSLLPLVTKLLDDPAWAPIYADTTSIVYVKDTPANKHLIDRFRKTREEVLNTIVVRISLIAQGSIINPLPMESLGDAFLLMGKREDAIKAYTYALKRRPDEPKIRAKLDKLEGEEKKNE